MLLTTGRLQAADKPLADSIDANRELLRLRMVMDDTTHLLFNAICYFGNVDSTTVPDTMHITYRISKYKYRIVMNDSLEIVQNNLFNLVLYHDRDVAVLSRPVDLTKHLYQANLNDPTFHKLYITGMNVSVVGSFRKLSYQFKPGSPYGKFDIIYDPSNYRIQKIEYQVRKDPFSTGQSTSDDHFDVNIVFSGYQTGGFDDTVFSTDPYVLRKQGVLNMVAPYSDYQLINSLNQ